MDLKEMIKVMQHYDNGGEIECSEDNFESVLCEANKKDDGDLAWDWDTFAYRIKKPIQNVKIEKWLIKDIDSGEYFTIESSDADLTLKDFPSWWKVKIIETNVVDL